MINKRLVFIFMLSFLLLCSLTAQTTIKSGAQLVTEYSANLFFEGATWDPVTQKLYFTTPNNAPYNIYRLDSRGSASIWMSNAQAAVNGTFLSIDGRLLTAEQDTRQIGSYKIGTTGPEDAKVIAKDSTWNRPNDLYQTKKGDIYLTCPNWSSGKQAVYHISTSGTVKEIISNLPKPNGVLTSLDDTKLYISDSDQKNWMVYPINADGTVGSGSVFFNPSVSGGFDPDGMTIDEKGNLYLTGRGGFRIVSPAGVQLDFIAIAEQASNIEFGGIQGTTLYITCKNKVYSIETTVHGARWQQTTIQKGDVNGDGTINIVDALMIAQYSIGIQPANFNTQAADVNCSGAIDIIDALMTAQFSVGLINAFSC